MHSIFKKLTILTSSLASLTTLSFKTLAQSPPAEVDLPPNTQDLLEQTLPQDDRPLPPETPRVQPKPNLQTPTEPKFPNCPVSPEGERFFISGTLKKTRFKKG